MGWKVKIGEHLIDLEDQELSFFEETAKLDGRASEYGMAVAPLLDANRAWLVVRTCALSLDVEPPPGPEKNSAKELKRLLAEFYEWEDDEIADRVVVDGNPQTPGEPANTSTSSSPGDMDGPTTSSDDNDSQT